MKKVGIFVGERGNWSFFREIFDDLRTRYETSVYEPKVYRSPLLQGRLNRWSHVRGIETILRHSDVAFFEWASELLETASRNRKYCPIVTRLHAYELYAWGPRINWHNVDRVILVSDAMRRNFIEEFPDHAHKTTVVPNGVRLDQFRPTPREGGTLNLGMLCSFFPRKRVYETILMFSRLRSHYPGARLHLGGGRVHAPDADEYYVACRRLVTTLGLEEAVVFYDQVSQTSDWLRQIDVFISNSYWEGQQVALLEALAAGCYCLSHRWTGAEEILPPDSLSTTEDELLNGILKFASLSTPEKQALHERMRQIACDKFDVENQKQRVRQVLDGVLNTAERPAPQHAVSTARRLRSTP